MSSAVAAGHVALTTITFTVISGFSARPMLKNAMAPAIVTAMIKNRVRACSRTAKAERLNRVTSLARLWWSEQSGHLSEDERPAPRCALPLQGQIGRAHV